MLDPSWIVMYVVVALSVLIGRISTSNKVHFLFKEYNYNAKYFCTTLTLPDVRSRVECAAMCRDHGNIVR